MVQPESFQSKLVGESFQEQISHKTAWIIEGFYQGHQDLAKPEAVSGVLQRKIETMHKIGGSRRRLTSVLAGEIVVVRALGVLFSGGLTLLTSWFASALIRNLILS